MKVKRNFLILLATLIGWLLILQLVGPEKLVEYIGIENGYVVITLIALFGGVSSFTGVTYIAAIITFASVGLSPVGLAIASGIGVSFGDTLYFYLGKHGRSSISQGSLHTFFEKVTKWLEGKSEYWVSLFTVTYTAISPFPNDILALTLGALRQRYIIVVPAMICGNIIFTFILASLGKTVGL